jgi:hypothetical protein
MARALAWHRGEVKAEQSDHLPPLWKRLYFPISVPVNGLFICLINHEPAVLFSKNKPATSNQPAVLFSEHQQPTTSQTNRPQDGYGCSYQRADEMGELKKTKGGG